MCLEIVFFMKTDPGSVQRVNIKVTKLTEWRYSRVA